MNSISVKIRTSIALVCVLCFSSLATFGADFTISNGNDDGTGSLRQAILDANAAGDGPHTFTMDGTYTITLSSNLPTITVSGITFDAENKLTILARSYGGDLNRKIWTIGTGGDNTTLKNMDVFNTGRYGVYVKGIIDGLTIDNIDISQTGGDEARKIDHLLYVITNIKNVTVSNCDASDYLQDGYGFAYFLGTTENITISNCSFTNGPGGAGYGVKFLGVANNININNCLFDFNDVESSNDGDYGIYFASTTTDVTIDAVTINDAETYSIFVGGVCTNFASSNLIITNINGGSGSQGIRFNSIVNTASFTNDNINMNRTETSDDGNYSLFFASISNNLTFNNSTYHDADYDGIYLGGNVTGMSMTNCNVTNDGISQQNGDLIEFYSGAANSGLVFTNCTFSGAERYGFILNATSAQTTATFTNCGFINTSSYSGLYIIGGIGAREITLNQCQFVNNADHGINLLTASNIELNECVFYGNANNSIELNNNGNSDYELADGDVPNIISATQNGNDYTVVYSLPSLCSGGDCEVEFFVNNFGDNRNQGRTYLKTETLKSNTTYTTTITTTNSNDGFFTATLFRDGFGTSEFSEILPMNLKGPAGVVGGIKTWLRADKGVDGTAWTDFSNNGNSPIDRDTDPDATTGKLINFNPVFYYDGNDIHWLPEEAEVTDDYTIFGIAQMEGSKNGRVFSSSEDNYLMGYHSNDEDELYLKEWLHAPNTPASTDLKMYSVEKTKSTDAWNFKANGITIGSTTEADKEGEWRLTIGGYRTGEYSSVYVPEAIVYNRDLTDAEMQKVETYLAIKYGFTLPSNYVSPTGVVVWDNTANAAYNNDVTGIGRDDASVLSQLKSKSENSDGVITIMVEGEGTSAAPVFVDLTDGTYLVWGNNNNDNTWSTAGAPADYNILNRTWKVAETNETGTLLFEIEVNNSDFNIAENAASSKLYLVIDANSDGNLSNDVPVLIYDDGTNGDAIAGDYVYTASGINLNNNNIFTLATFIDNDVVNTAGASTWTAPAGVCSIVVETWGAGGGGGSSEKSTWEGSSGGAGGAYSKSTISVVPGTVYNIYVGSGGSKGSTDAAQNGDGGNGEDTWFSTTTNAPTSLTEGVLAKGGNGGLRDDIAANSPYIIGALGQLGGQAANGIGEVKYNGGNGGDGWHGSYGQAGGGGSSAGLAANGTDGQYASYTSEATCAVAPFGGGEGGFGGTGQGAGNVGEDGTLPGGGAGGGGGDPGELGGNGANGQIKITWAKQIEFNNPTTWTAPEGITSIEVQVWGAGGGGAGNPGFGDAGAGGGGGAYSKATITVVPGTTYNVQVGLGGFAGPITGTTTGGIGEDSWFGTTATILAKGGFGGTFTNGGGVPGTGGQSADGIGTEKYSGGNGAAGYTTNNATGGGGGASAGTFANGNNGIAGGNTGEYGEGGLAISGGSYGGQGGKDFNNSNNECEMFHGHAGGFAGGGGGASSGDNNGAYRDTPAKGAAGSNGRIVIIYDLEDKVLLTSNAQAAATILAGTNDVVVHSFSLTDYYACNRVTINDLNLTTTGSFIAADITNFKLYYTANNSFGSNNLLGTIETPLASGIEVFTGVNFQQPDNIGYYWITVDIPEASTNNATITFLETNASSFVSSYIPTGIAFASGEQIIDATFRVQGTIVDVDCATGTLGNINVATINGVAPYTYLWSNGSSTESLTNVEAGVYTLRAKDSNGDKFKSEFRVYACAQFTDMENVTEQDFSLTKTNADPELAGAKSKNLLYVTSTGGIKYVVEDLTKNFAAGFSIETKDDLDVAHTVSAFEIENDKLDVYVYGTLANTYNGLVTGDIVELVQDFGSISLLINNYVHFTVDSVHKAAMKLDFIALKENSPVTNLKVTFGLPEFYFNSQLLETGITIDASIDGIAAGSSEVPSVETYQLPIGFNNDEVEFIFDLTPLSGETSKIKVLSTKYGTVNSVWQYDATNSIYNELNNSMYTFGANRELILIPFGKTVFDLPYEQPPVYLTLESGFVLSPNGDNNYDELSLVGAELVDDFELKIYNLSNTEVYQTTVPEFTWDGKDYSTNLVKGTYNYTLSINGQAFSGMMVIDF